MNNRYCSLVARVIALYTLSLFTLSGCSSDAPESTFDHASRPVKIIDLNAAATDQSASYPAIIGASRKSELSFPVSGLIDQLPVTESDAVEQGDLIASLDSRDFKSAVASARAVFTNAEEEYQRGKRLAAQDAISRSALEQRKSQRDVAQSQLESAEKAFEDSVLRAPFTGAVALVPARRLQAVSAGTVIATVIDITNLDATINIPASVLALVPTREDAAATVFLQAAPEREIRAFFRQAELVADATSQTYSVTFSFASPENLLVLPGMNATVVLRTSNPSGDSLFRMSVPLAAVLSDGGGQYVWRVDPETMTVSRRNVEIAPGIGETVVVTTGLASGDRIVGAGGAYLAEGIRVTQWKK